MAYCTKCGKLLSAGDCFCASCGNPIAGTASMPPVSPTPPPASAAHPQPLVMPPPKLPTPTAASEETVSGAFPVSRKKGLFALESFHIVFTTRRLILAAFTNEMVKAAAKEEGKAGFLAGMMGAMTLGYNYYKHYQTKDPEAALMENPQNFAIDISRIRKIKLELGKRQIDHSRNIDTYDNSKLEIETVGDKFTFAVPHHFYNMAQDIIRKSGLM